VKSCCTLWVKKGCHPNHCRNFINSGSFAKFIHCCEVH